MKKIDYKTKIHQLEKKHSLIDEIKDKLPEENISIHIDSPSDFFNDFDCSEIEHRELSQDLEDYLVGKVDKIDHLVNLKITVNIENSDQIISNENLKKAIENHFEFKTIEQFKENHKLHKKWLRNFIVGLFFLGFCLLLSQIFHMPYFEDKPVFAVLRESLSIIGWVAIWEPTGYFLFGKKENNRILRNYMILHKADYRILTC